MRHKSKIHPSSSPFLHSLTKNVQSVLNLLPATILAIALVLPIEDREVLAYMITRSINITTSFTEENRGEEHMGPVFSCDCFDCYISYWFRWDCSPNRELIHQAIEAFEEGLNNAEEYRMKVEKMGFSGVEKVLVLRDVEGLDLPAAAAAAPEIQEWGVTEKGSPENEVSGLELADLVSESGESSELMELEMAAAAAEEEVAVVVRGGGGNSQKGLARKMLTDMLGLFSFRLWSLWKIEAE